MINIDPGAIGFTSGFSQEHKYSMVGEQITVEQLIELSIVRASLVACVNLVVYFFTYTMV